MKTRNSEMKRKKTLLAIAFAGGMLNSQVTAFAEEPRSTQTLIQNVENDSRMRPEVQAYYLLRISNSYLSNKDRTAVEAQYNSLHTIGPRTIGRDNFFVNWADQVSLQAQSAKVGVKSQNGDQTSSDKIPSENLKLAEQAAHSALKLAGKTSSRLTELNIYFIASQLFQMTGNKIEEQRCTRFFEDAIKACESKAPTIPEEAIAASSILNSMAYGKIPVRIPDYVDPRSSRTPTVKPFTEEEFKSSEAFKLRSIAILDRLPSNNHDRRKAHRDLALWYETLGKNELAEQQKQVLFNLVGIRDESILNPQPAGCGSVVWWTIERIKHKFMCGVG